MEGSLRTYRTTFRRLVALFSDLPVDRVTAAQLAAAAADVRRVAAAKKGGTGVGAEEGFIRGARFFYRVAVEAEVRETNPADRVRYFAA